MLATEVLRDLCSRPLDALDGFVDRLTPELLQWHPLGHPNSIGWLLWHAARQMDAQIAALTGGAEAYTEEGFAERFASSGAAPADSIGYGQSDAEASAVRVTDPALARMYLAAATMRAQSCIAGIREPDDLDEIVDRSFEPPVNRGARLVSIADDAVAHVAQAAYILGMHEREDAKR